MKNIKTKLIVSIFLIILLSTTLLSLYNYNESKKIAINIIKKNNITELNNISDYYFNKLISDMEYIINNWSKKPEIYSYEKHKNQKKIVNSIPNNFKKIYDEMMVIVNSYQNITWIYYALEEDGSIFIAPVDESIPNNYDARKREWYKGTLKNENKIYWTKPYIDAGNSRKLLQTVSKPVYDEKNNLKGVIALDIELSKFTKIIKNLSYAQNSYIFLLNQDGEILGDNLQNENSKYYKIIQKYNQTTESQLITENNNKYVISSVPIDLNNWKLVSLSPTNLDEKLAPIKKRLIIIISISLFISLIIAIYLSKLLLKPLNELVTVTNKISAGNLNVKANISTKDEFQQLGTSYNNMINKVQNLLNERDENYINTIKVIANAIEASDAYTKGHCDRVGNLSLTLARDLGLKENRIENLKLACILHDVGKIGVPDKILNKPSPLNNEEYEFIKKHPIIGYNIISEIDFLKKPAKILLQHHERIDGKGYPYHLKDEEILFEAKILAVADAYDAMSSKRIYRESTLNFNTIIAELENGIDKQFDEKVATLLINKLKKENKLI